MGSQLSKWRWLLWPAIFLGVITLAAPFFLRWKGQAETTPAAAAPAKPVDGVACIGHIEPVDGVIRVSAPYTNGHPSLVSELLVKEGAVVRKGQVLAVLEGRPQLEAALRQSEARVALATTRIEQAKAGPKTADVAAQREAIARLDAALAHSQSELRRYEALAAKRDVSASEVEAKRAEMENDSHLRDEARARLRSLSEIRLEDVRIYESELAVAQAETARVRLDLESAVVRAPSDGKVMHLRAHAGEEIGPQGLVEMAKTGAMCVIAEVYETDLGRVRIGQKARITGELLPNPLEGTVAFIGGEVSRTEMASPDPAAFADSRVVNVRIQVTDSAAIAGLIHGKVTVAIAP